MIGVSPAYYISRYGSDFTVSDIIDGMEFLSDNMFDTLQLEIFHYEQLDQWTFSNCMRLKEALCSYGLKASQFVAHFLMNCFEDPESLKSDKGLAELEFISVILNLFSLADRVTIPIPPFSGNCGDRDILYLFDSKLKRAESILSSHSLLMALEPQPRSLAADLSYLNRHENIGLNLDPGHLLCSGVDPFAFDLDTLSRVYATHFCENDKDENLSLRPGTYKYNWSSLMGNLIGSGYDGSFDLEIICAPDQVENEYRSGKFFLSNYCIQNNVCK